MQEPKRLKIKGVTYNGFSLVFIAIVKAFTKGSNDFYNRTISEAETISHTYMTISSKGSKQDGALI